MTFFYSCAGSSASHYVFLSIWSIWKMCAFERRGLRDSNLELDRERCGCTKPQCQINKDYFKPQVMQSWPNQAQESPPLISKSVLLNSRQLTVTSSNFMFSTSSRSEFLCYSLRSNGKQQESNKKASAIVIIFI